MRKTIIELGSGNGCIKKIIDDKKIILTDITKYPWIDKKVDMMKINLGKKYFQKVDVFKQDKDKVLIVCHLNSNNDTENIIAKLATEKTKLYQLERHGPTLENVFLQYIKKGKNSKEKK